MSRYVTGTIAQLSKKLTLNGVVLNPVTLNQLSQALNGHGMRQVGTVRRVGKRGRPAVIWEVDTIGFSKVFLGVNGGKASSGLIRSSRKAYARAA